MQQKFNFRQASPALLFVLACGLVVELTNLQSLFFQFMQIYRPEWREITNNVTACFFSLGLLAAIVTYGLRGNQVVSFALAILTMIISLFVYRKIAAFDLDNMTLQHNHIVVLILAIIFPLLVAYTTHELHKDQQTIPTLEDEISDKIATKHKLHFAEKMLRKQRQALADKNTQIIADKSQPQITEPNMKKPQRINELVEELKEQVLTPASKQAPSETIIKDDTELDIMELMHGQLPEKK